METAQRTLITIETTVNAPVDKVWHVWTEPAHIMKWNFASNDWHCPDAKNDVRKGGQFSSVMAAKDGSMSFEFGGEYTEVIPNEKLAYVIGDGRTVIVTFKSEGNKTKVTEAFEAETQNSIEMQRAGWQAILNNFKHRTETTDVTDKISFEGWINAPVDKVYTLMIADNTYQEWTAAFNPTSRFEGSWEKGSKIKFLGTSENGDIGGMVANIRENIPNKLISIEHLGEIKGDQEITTGPTIESWSGALENYHFTPKDGGTLLKVEMNTNADFKSYFESTWPKAIELLKNICER